METSKQQIKDFDRCLDEERERKLYFRTQQHGVTDTPGTYRGGSGQDLLAPWPPWKAGRHLGWEREDLL